MYTIKLIRESFSIEIKQRLDVTQTLVNEFKLLFLDEPTFAVEELNPHTKKREPQVLFFFVKHLSGFFAL